MLKRLLGRKTQPQSYALLGTGLNDWAAVDRRSVAAQLRGCGDGREKKWFKYEQRMCAAGIPIEDIPRLYSKKVAMKSRIYDLLAVAPIVLILLLSGTPNQGFAELNSALAFFGLIGAYYLLKKYIRKADGGFLGYRSWMELFSSKKPISPTKN